MVAGLKFLSKKGFNPQNLSNQKRVWEREQQEKQEARRIKERANQLEREREEEELAKARGDQPRLGFLYDAPPGLEKDNKQQSRNNTSINYEDEDDSKPPAQALIERQPGDDDAAAAFRASFAASAKSSTESNTDHNASAQSQSAFGTVLHGTSFDPMAQEKQQQDKKNANLSALEKAVGRKKEGQAALTLDEQIQRFPALANAPRAKGLSASDIGVSFKPLGSQIRNVKCMACGVWGHSRGDRECKQSGWNPFEAVTQRPTAVETGKRSDEKHEKRSSEDSHRNKKRNRDEDDNDSSSLSDSSSSSHEDRRARKKQKDRHRDSGRRRHHRHNKSSRHKHRKHSKRDRRDRSRSESLDDESRKRSSRERYELGPRRDPTGKRDKSRESGDECERRRAVQRQDGRK